MSPHCDAYLVSIMPCNAVFSKANPCRALPCLALRYAVLKCNPKVIEMIACSTFNEGVMQCHIPVMLYKALLSLALRDRVMRCYAIKTKDCQRQCVESSMRILLSVKVTQCNAILSNVVRSNPLYCAVMLCGAFQTNGYQGGSVMSIPRVGIAILNRINYCCAHLIGVKHCRVMSSTVERFVARSCDAMYCNLMVVNSNRLGFL